MTPGAGTQGSAFRATLGWMISIPLGLERKMGSGLCGSNAGWMFQSRLGWRKEAKGEKSSHRGLDDPIPLGLGKRMDRGGVNHRLILKG
jgi:hypothetical protein